MGIGGGARTHCHGSAWDARNGFRALLVIVCREHSGRLDTSLRRRNPVLEDELLGVRPRPMLDGVLLPGQSDLRLVALRRSNPRLLFNLV